MLKPGFTLAAIAVIAPKAVAVIAPEAVAVIAPEAVPTCSAVLHTGVPISDDTQLLYQCASIQGSTLIAQPALHNTGTWTYC